MAARKKKKAAKSTKKKARARRDQQGQNTAKKPAKRAKAAKKAKRVGSANPKGKTPAALAATTWKKGQSGNPAGRPKKATMRELVERVMAESEPDSQSLWSEADEATKAEMVARQIVKMLMAGDQRVLKMYLDRDWPALRQIELTGSGGGPLEVGTSDDFIDLLMEKVTEARRANRNVDIDLPEGT